MNDLVLSKEYIEIGQNAPKFPCLMILPFPTSGVTCESQCSTVPHLTNAATSQ
ncbi:hypothetical protein HAX54_026780, partial [Datura stramonium]|nr:hypothetical protein [Datura stramonium]